MQKEQLTLSQQISKLQRLINYTFIDHALLIEALTHPSLKQKPTDKNYERLELLGDSILNFVITEQLFKNFSVATEGKLAKLRACLVCKDTLSQIAQDINISEYILMTQGEEALGGRANKSNLENVLEAVIAAIYIDSGSIDIIKNIILKLWATWLSNPNIQDSDPKTILQEWAQDQFNSKPMYKVLEKVGAVHAPTFNVMVTVNEYTQTGQGTSIKSAEKNAARNLIKLLNINDKI